MTVESINPMPMLASTPTLGTTSASALDWLNSLQQQFGSIEQSFEAMAQGEDISVPELVNNISVAKLELELMVEVRNKLLEGYQELTRMQL